MRGTRNGVVGVLGASALLLSACGGTSAGGSGDDAGVVKVGLAGGFSGPTAYLGQDSKKGVELAIKELNEDGTDLEFELVTADDECSPQGGATAFARLADVDRVDVILGSPCSGSTLGGKPILARSQLPGMTFGASNSAITEDAGVGGAEYQWRMNIDDSIMGEAFAGLIAESGTKSVGILAVNNDFGQGAAEVYEKFLPEQGVEVTTTETYEYQSADVRSQLNKIEKTGADALLLFGEAPNCALTVRNMDELGLDLPVYARSACTTEEALVAMKDPQLGNGITEVSYWSGTPDQPMIEAFEEEFGNYPAYNSAMAYYGMMTLAKAAELGGSDRAGIQEGLGQVNWDSPIGQIKFDDHNQAHHDMFVLTIEDGKIKVLDRIPTATD